LGLSPEQDGVAVSLQQKVYFKKENCKEKQKKKRDVFFLNLFAKINFYKFVVVV